MTSVDATGTPRVRRRLHDYTTARADWDERAMAAIVPERAPWDFDKFREYISLLSVDDSERLAEQIDAFRAKEAEEQRATEAAHQARLRSDPVYAAENELLHAQKRVESVKFDAWLVQRPLDSHDATISTLQARKLAAKNDPRDWLELSQQLHVAQIERERLMLILADHSQALATAEQWAASARAKLEALQSTPTSVA